MSIEQNFNAVSSTEGVLFYNRVIVENPYKKNSAVLMTNCDLRYIPMTSQRLTITFIREYVMESPIKDAP